jgi:hypothetical protein
MIILVISNDWLFRSLPKLSERRKRLSWSEIILLPPTGMYATFTNKPMQRLTLTTVIAQC